MFSHRTTTLANRAACQKSPYSMEAKKTIVVASIAIGVI